MTLYPPGIGTSHGSFLIWLLGTALGIPQMSHTATFKSKAKDHIPKQNRSDLRITSQVPKVAMSGRAQPALFSSR